LNGKLDLIALRNNKGVVDRLGFEATNHLYGLFLFSMGKKPSTLR
jgi:hypothetical protein